MRDEPRRIACRRRWRLATRQRDRPIRPATSNAREWAVAEAARVPQRSGQAMPHEMPACCDEWKADDRPDQR
jgi:hypothetical protein